MPKYDWPTIWPDAEKLTRNWLGLILTIGVLALGVPALWVIVRFVAALAIGTSTDVRNIGIIFLAFFGAPFVIWRAIVAQGNLDRSRDRDYADLFTKAVEQLGADKNEKFKRIMLETPSEAEFEYATTDERTVPNIEVRLGAIYALERISRDSSSDHIAVIETLCTYIRQNAPAHSAVKMPTKQELETWKENNHVSNFAISHPTAVMWGQHLEKPRADIQAALTVIGRRKEERISLEKKEYEKNNRHIVDLSDINIQNAHLYNLNFEGSIFVNSVMNGALLNGSNFKGCQLQGSDLRGAVVSSVKFNNSIMHDTKMSGIGAHFTSFERVNLENSDLSDGTFWGANFAGARFSQVNLDFANFSTANLSVKNLTPSSLKRFFGCAGTILPVPIEIFRPPEWAETSLDTATTMIRKYEVWLSDNNITVD